MTDWRNAQVIEANVDAPGGPRRVLCRAWNPSERRPEWMSLYSGRFYEDDQLSDVRVIVDAVDAEGKVVPPPITDEMVERGVEALLYWNRKYGFGDRLSASCVRTILTAALGGADHD